MRNTRRSLGMIAIGTVAALTLGACSDSGSGDTDDTTTDDNTPAETAPSAEEPAADGPLVVYSGRDEELVGPLLQQFQDSSGIEIEVRYAGTTELAAQLLTEGEGTSADVFLSQDAGALGALSNAGLFTTLPAEVTDLVGDEYTSRDGSWVGLTGRARVIAYDSETYSEDEVPGNLFDLTAPEWNGKVGIAPSNAGFQAHVTAIRVSEGEDAARAWLEGLIANDAQIFQRNGEMLEAVNNGAVDLALLNHYYWSRSEEDPATLRAQLKFGDPGSVSALVNVTGVGILTGSESNPDAQALVEYLVSDEAQTYFLEQTAEYPLTTQGTPAGVPPLSEVGGPDIDLSELATLEETVALITEVGLL